MARHLFLFFIWSGACMSLTGQSTADEWVDVYPIRVNHKFGYIKIYHAPFLYIDTVIPPITAMDMGIRDSAPGPMARAGGIAAAMADVPVLS